MITCFLFIILFSPVVLSTNSDDVYETYKDYKIYEVGGDEHGVGKVIRYLLNHHELRYHSAIGDKCQVMVAPRLVPTFEAMVKAGGMSSKLLVDDYSKIIKMEKSTPQRNTGFSWTAYHDVDEIYVYLQNMSKTYPNMAQTIVGGSTYEQRQILGLRINVPIQRNNKTLQKPAMIIESGMHGREWISIAATTYFINELLTNKDVQIQALRNSFDWHIFPTVNPDGYHYSFTKDRMWRKTRSNHHGTCRGADGNRNFDYNWGKHSTSENPCDYQVYGGPQAFSEIETKSLSKYILNLKNILGYISVHADAQMMLFPYSDTDAKVSNYYDLKAIGRKSLEYGFKVNQKSYKGPATANEILYKASGSSMDWVRHNLNTSLVYTYELRGFFFSWPPSRIHEQGDEFTQMILGLAVEAKNLEYY